MSSLSFIEMLFTYPVIIYQTCMQENPSSCQNHGWSYPGSVITCSGIPVLAGFGQSTTLQKTFIIPPNRHLRFNLTIFKIDSWDSETLQIKLNNVLLKELKFEMLQGEYICDPNGVNGGDFPDYSVDLSFEFIEQSNQITISITDNLDQPVFDESWGFRDFLIEVVIPCVSLHSECDYQGEEFKICSGDNTKFQNDLPFPIKSIKIDSGAFVTLHDIYYHSGESQMFTESQPCVDEFKFPKFFFKE